MTAFAAALVAVALAAEPPGFGAISPATAGRGRNLVVAGAGWPGVELGYARGLTPTFELGARVSYQYGYEGLLAQLEGFRVQAVARFLLAAGEKVSLGLAMAPGLLLYLPRGGTLVGVTLPLLLTFGVELEPRVTLSLSAELPLWVRFGPGGGLFVPLLLGPGVEARLLPELSIWVRGRGGPTVFSYTNRPAPTLDVKAGVGLRF